MKIFKKIKNSEGFVILFAVTISAILLAIALGVANIALNEVKFGTNARDTNDAFYAADTATEFALFSDKSPGSSCTAPGTCNSVISGLGSTGQGCAKVSIVKTSPPSITTTLTIKGYNIGGSVPGACNPPLNSVERELDTHY